MNQNKINIEKLIQISEIMNREDLASDLKLINSRLNENNKSIIIPIVGEFSSGKTSLINSLISNNLETASKATTSTIFEINFGSKTNHANIISEEGVETNISDFSKLQNKQLQNSKLVKIYDCSTKVPSSTILVDTPGLSSNDPKHRLALTSYLPLCDAIFLVTDINQQLTRSLLEFIDSANFSNKPIYLIISKSDTKTKTEVTEAKQYAINQINNSNLNVAETIVISSTKNKMDEFFELINKIQKDKNEIVIKALHNRVKNIKDDLNSYIDQVIKSTEHPDKLEEEVDRLEAELENTYKNIKRLISDSEVDIEDKAKKIINLFDKKVSEKLDIIIQNQGRFVDNQVYESVNTIASQSIDIFKSDVQFVLSDLAKKRKNSLEKVPLHFLESLDFSMITSPQLSYNINLSEAGHKYDKTIGYGIIAAVAVATIVATYGAAAPAVAASTTKTAASTATASANMLNIVDTTTDVANIVSNTKTTNALIKTANTIQRGQKIINQANTVIDNFSPQQKGMIETSVGWMSDKLVGKPQRRKAINDYIENTLNPEFSLHLDYVRMYLLNIIEESLNDEAAMVINQMKSTLNSLIEEEKNSKKEYQETIKNLKNYKSILNNYGK